jgi:uncharacterized protein (TIGR02271 family)
VQTSTTAAEQVFGYDVIDGSGNKIGTVDNVWVDDATTELEFIGIKTGWLFGKTHVIPTADAQIDNGNRTISIPYGEDQIKNAPSFASDDELSPEDENRIYSSFGLDRSTAPSPTGLASGQSGTTETATSSYGTSSGYGTGSSIDTSGTTSELASGQENINVPLSEEELAVGKRQVQAGQVRLRKVVHTEHKEVPVELRREEVQIERVPAAEAGNVPGNAFEEQEITVPVMQEEPVVEKQARVTGQVRLSKDQTSETQTVGGEVRREEVDVDRETDGTTFTK